MTIRVALHHRTSYTFDRSVVLFPHLIRLRPAPHCRTPICAYSLSIEPDGHFINWQQDPQGNYVARLVFPKPQQRLQVEVDLVAEMAAINPFDFFLEPEAETVPFAYPEVLLSELAPFRRIEPVGPRLADYLLTVDRSRRKTIDFLVDLNQRLQHDVGYVIRLEPGVQPCDDTLSLGTGSCRDSAWLLVQILRHLGLAARFVSGYLIQLVADQKPLEGPAGPAADFTDLHAWCEVYLPGAGWVGLDPTSGLLAGEGHIPLACTPDPQSAAPIAGATAVCEAQFDYAMAVTRIHEDPRVTKPYTEQQWQTIHEIGVQVDTRLQEDDVRLTMGGEPTFVSIDDMEGDEWRSAAVGPMKRSLADQLVRRLKNHFAPAGLLHFGQGKWYPGEQLPRWALSCYWRHDGEPIWRNAQLFADTSRSYGYGYAEAELFARQLCRRLELDSSFVIPAYEDAWYYLWRERRLPVNVHPRDARLEDETERLRLSRVFEQGLGSPVGCVLPLRRAWWLAQPRWETGPWPVRADDFLLIPGDSPIGFRLPLDALPWARKPEYPTESFERDPLEQRLPLASYHELRQEIHTPDTLERHTHYTAVAQRPILQRAGGGSNASTLDDHSLSEDCSLSGGTGRPADRSASQGNGRSSAERSYSHDVEGPHPETPASSRDLPDQIIRTALCVEPREGRLHIFMPPVDHLEDYLSLVAAVEDTAEELSLPVVIEGYTPPHDPRLEHIKVTPDPGVIEVNVHPAHSWDQLVEITGTVYHEARESRLGTEKFDRDGRHTGTGGGNHVVLGGPTPADSPFLRRPDLLRSLVAFWHNHPSLSYLFSGTFIGPTSQAPRVDEGRRDAIYELEIAFQQVHSGKPSPPWLVDRLFRNLLVDVTGNTHRAEFCIDKLYSPDTATGRLGLVEFRAFEMPPHWRMSLTQQLLLRALVSQFWRKPYDQKLVPWDTSLHDRFMLPHFVWQDFEDVIDQLRADGYALEMAWFAPHFEFRFPVIGQFTQRSVQVELRQAIEPWYVLGEEGVVGATARFVDSSLERLQVKVSGLTDSRHLVTCNGRRVPLHPTGEVGQFVAGVRYRAWQPPRCLHPTIAVHEPLVFDLLDTWNDRSIGGCKYHVGHPGGLNPETFPVNALEAESRRAARFFRMGHTGGTLSMPPEESNPDFPLTLDLRRGGPADAVREKESTI